MYYLVLENESILLICNSKVFGLQWSRPNFLVERLSSPLIQFVKPSAGFRFYHQIQIAYLSYTSK